MGKEARMYWLHAITPLHVGAGRGVGYIDVPIMREKVTNWPLVPGSAVKGVLRDHHEVQKTPHLDIAFGTAGGEQANSGSLVFTDARLFCLPVRSFHGTFAWCTSSLVLQRLSRDLEYAGVASPAGKMAAPDDTEVWLPNGDTSKLRSPEGKLFLEDLDFSVCENDDANGWATFFARGLFAGEPAWSQAFQERFAVLSDNAFDFLCGTGTEVNARVRIEEHTKTVAHGALWYEEALPAETVLGGLVWCDRVFGGSGIKRSKLLDDFCRSASLRLGGKATIGRGQVRCLFSEEGWES